MLRCELFDDTDEQLGKAPTPVGSGHAHSPQLPYDPASEGRARGSQTLETDDADDQLWVLLLLLLELVILRWPRRIDHWMARARARARALACAHDPEAAPRLHVRPAQRCGILHVEIAESLGRVIKKLLLHDRPGRTVIRVLMHPQLEQVAHRRQVTVLEEPDFNPGPAQVLGQHARVVRNRDIGRVLQPVVAAVAFATGHRGDETR